MRLTRLPDCVRALPTLAARQKAMQAAINAALHRQNICPRGQHMCGIGAPRVGVYHQTKPRCWYIEATFDEDGAKNFEHIALNAVESMTFVNSED